MAALHFLLIEPDKTTAGDIGAVVEGAGWTAAIARSGEEAFRAAAEQAPDVVGMDVHSLSAPRLMAAELRIRYGRRLPILALSPKSDEAAVDDVAAFDSIRLPDEISEIPERLAALDSTSESHVATGYSQSPGQGAAHEPELRWRYKVLSWIGGIVYEDGAAIDAVGQRSLREHANLLGDSGWELVGATARDWIFKRPRRTT